MTSVSVPSYPMPSGITAVFVIRTYEATCAMCFIVLCKLLYMAINRHRRIIHQPDRHSCCLPATPVSFTGLSEVMVYRAALPPSGLFSPPGFDVAIRL